MIFHKYVNANKIYWSQKLDGDLWVYRTTFNTPIGMSPYQLVFSKACHILIEHEYNELWPLKKLYLKWKDAHDLRLDRFNKMDKFLFGHMKGPTFIKKVRIKL